MRKDEIGWYKTSWGAEPYCLRCHAGVHWVECEQCEDGYSYHDCGEDTCCCLNPENNVVCDTCDGEGGWYICEGCNRWECNCEPYELSTREKLEQVAKIETQLNLLKAVEKSLENPTVDK
jgi:hypothetical protein